ncbi:hypothetical protein ACNOYE_13540 [Nannocystaceae bacterium ST9]
MKFTRTFSIALFALVLGLSLTTACDDGDDEGTDEAADNGDGDTTGDTASEDVTCDVFCEAYITQCLQTGESTEFETNDLCLAACGAWDQAGINCRNEQIGAGACDQAGNMGSACN